MAATSEHVVKWGVAAWALDDAAQCGDAYFAQGLPRGALFAVIDGLGHGAAAALAASSATDVLRQHCREALPDLVRRCHEAERGLRGVAMSLASIDAERRQLSWLGVGNVSGMQQHAAEHPAVEHLLVRPGIVGFNLPSLQVRTVPVDRGDTILLATDGVALGALPRVPRHMSVQQAAEELLDRSKTKRDDALVFVARMDFEP